MARPKGFDVEQVLDRATDVFWTNGFEGTSLSDLETELGIGRQSLYDTFGDKHQLFLRALDRYVARQQAVLAPLEHDEASLPAIREYLENVICFVTGPAPRRACLIANTILEVGQRDAPIAARCRANQRRVMAAMKRAVRNAKEDGEVSPALDVETTAAFLMSQVYGLTLLAKNGGSLNTLRQVVAQSLEQLR